jgi:hypothetical protein
MPAILTITVITWRMIGPAIVFVLLMPLAIAGIRRRLTLPPTWAFASLSLAPIAVAAWSGAFWGTEQSLGDDRIHWASDIQLLLALMGLALLIGVPWRFRRQPRWWLLIVASAANFIVLVGAAFVGSMAIANSWL